MVDAGWSRTYVNKSVQRIRRCFKWGVAKQLVPSSTLEALKAVDGLRRGKTEARENARVLPIDDAIVDATVAKLPEVVGDMVKLQRLTGARPIELCTMRPCDIDRTGEVWVYSPVDYKTAHHDRERHILIGPKGQAIVLKYLARDPAMPCFRPCDSEAKRLAERRANRTTPLSCGNRPGTNRKSKRAKPAGTSYSVDSYRRCIHYACDRAKVARWSPNRLRHSAATEVRKQFGLEAAQLFLGHAACDVTQVYAERDLSKALEVARQIG